MPQQFEHRPHRDREEGRGRRERGGRKKREGDFGGKSSLFNSDVISGSNMHCGFQLVSESPPGFEVSVTLLWGPELSERSTSSERAHLAALLVHLSICSSVTQVSWRSPPCHAWKVGGGSYWAMIGWTEWRRACVSSLYISPELLCWLG